MSLIWLLAGIVLGIAELFTLDFVLIMFAGGCFAASATALAAPIPVQVVAFAVVSTLGVITLRPAIKRRLHRNAEPATLGVDALVNASATVVEPVGDDGGLVKIGGELWRARPVDRGQTCAVGARVVVVGVDGATALVRHE